MMLMLHPQGSKQLGQRTRDGNAGGSAFDGRAIL
jgi:hypothetical protein